MSDNTRHVMPGTRKQKVTDPAETPAGDELTHLRLRHAFTALQRSGALTGSRSRKLSTRVDPGLIEAARQRAGVQSDSDLVSAALAMLAAGDEFGPWLIGQAGRLPEAFELAL
jgi:hypothetical protein